MGELKSESKVESEVSSNSIVSFEAALEQLQNTVKSLEAGDLSLEQALKQFEQGVKLSRQCQEHLKSAEQRIEILLKDNGQWVKEPFNPA